MQGPTATPQAPAIPQGSMPSNAPVSPEGYQAAPVANQPSSYPTAPAPQAPAVGYSQAPAPAVNPWEAALQGLYNSSSATPNYQGQAQPWLQTPQPPAGYPVAPPAPAGVMAPPQVFQQPVYSQPAYQQPQVWMQPQAPAPVVATPSQPATAAPTGDQYLESLSGASLEVLQHFGPEAPALLNHYSCVVEDALLRQAQQTLELTAQAQALSFNLQNAHTLITAAAEDNAAYHTVLSSPPLLAQYATEFFGPGGPGELPQAPPEEGPRDRLAAEVAYGESSGRMLPPRSGATPDFPASYGQPQEQPQFQAQPPVAQAPAPQAQPQPGYQRPQFEMQAPGQAPAQGNGDFWQTFSYLMDNDPRAAAQFYSQNLTPQVLMSRQLMGEN